MNEKLKPCRWCDSTNLQIKRNGNGFYVHCEGCDFDSAAGLTIEDAEKNWSKAMTPSAQRHENGTEYRDRVDRMAAALAVLTNSSDYIAKQAMDIIDAIDKAIAEREDHDV